MKKEKVSMEKKANILETIVRNKIAEVEIQRLGKPIYELMEAPRFRRSCFSAKEALKKEGASGIIAEFKRQSPSKGVINNSVGVKEVVVAYQDAGASIVSVLTDQQFFGAEPEDFSIAREVLQIPVLRKDFIIDPYQVYQAKAMGADVVLLIAAILSPERCRDLAFLAKDLGMEVLLELHDVSELDHVNRYVDLVGINNRNLKDFSVDTEQSIRLAKQLPTDLIRVAESGLSDVGTVKRLRDQGFQAFLMGEHFMRDERPGEACKRFVLELNRTK